MKWGKTFTKGAWFVFAIFFGCVNHHLEPSNYACDPNDPISFDLVAPVFLARCATTACHSSANVYIPHLETKQQIEANKFDCMAQLNSGAMPPGGYSLSSSEKAKILCWLELGK